MFKKTMASKYCVFELQGLIENEKWTDILAYIRELNPEIRNYRQNGQCALDVAIEHNAPTDVVSALVTPENVNASETACPLAAAIKCRSWETVYYLLIHANASLNSKEGDSNLLDLALENNAPDDIVTFLVTSIHDAIRIKRWDKVWTLAYLGTPAQLDAYHNGLTPLLLALKMHAPVEIIQMLTTPTNINSSNDEYDPLKVAINANYWNITQFIVDQYYQLRGERISLEVLCWAINKHVHPESLEHLVHETNINGLKKCRPLIVAVKCKNWCAVNLLVSRGAFVDIADGHKKTALHWLFKTNDTPEMIVSLLALTVNINKQDAYGKTVLHYMFQNKLKTQDISFDILKMIISEENKNMTDGYGKTPLHVALQAKWKKCTIPCNIIQLLATDENIKLQDKFGKTPLHLATYLKWGDCLIPQELVSDENLNLQDSKGQSALHQATDMKYVSTKLAGSLIWHGIDCNILDSDDSSALMNLIYSASKHVPSEYMLSLEVLCKYTSCEVKYFSILSLLVKVAWFTSKLDTLNVIKCLFRNFSHIHVDSIEWTIDYLTIYFNGVSYDVDINNCPLISTVNRLHRFIHQTAILHLDQDLDIWEMPENATDEDQALVRCVNQSYVDLGESSHQPLPLQRLCAAVIRSSMTSCTEEDYRSLGLHYIQPLWDLTTYEDVAQSLNNELCQDIDSDADSY